MGQEMERGLNPNPPCRRQAARSSGCFADEGVSFPPLWLVLLASASPGHWASRTRRGQSGGAHCAHPLGWGGRGRVSPLPPRRGGHAPTDLFCAESPSCDGGAEKRSRTGTSGRWVGEGKKRQKEEGKGRNRSSQPGPAQPSPPQPGPARPPLPAPHLPHPPLRSARSAPPAGGPGAPALPAPLRSAPLRSSPLRSAEVRAPLLRSPRSPGRPRASDGRKSS